jgi:hypothetical protein
MLPIDFDRLQSDLPEYEAVWAALRVWFSKNWRKKYVELAVLQRAFPGVDKVDLVLAISEMISRRMLASAYRVKAPGGYLLEGDFDEPDKIPKELPDRDSSGNVQTDEADIVTGYKWESARAS